jgi:hypothetical protein
VPSRASIVEQYRSKVDLALATVLATTDADTRYFIGEATLGAIIMFLLNRYAGAYLDELGLKDAAKRHADATKELVSRIRSKSLRSTEQTDQEKIFSEAWEVLQVRGMSIENDRRAENALVRDLVELGAGREQARSTAAEVTATFRSNMDAS